MKSKHPFYLFVPLVLFFAIIGIDKILLIPFVKSNIILWKKVEPPFYESRYDLFEQLKQHYPAIRSEHKKLGIILGSSRSAEFNSDEIARFISGSLTYNFSAPFASPSFYYYWLTKILDAGIRPDFVIVEADAVLLTSRAGENALSYSYDPMFVWEHTDMKRKPDADPWASSGKGFSKEEWETYMLKYMFASYKYPIKITNIIENNRVTVTPSFVKGEPPIKIDIPRFRSMIHETVIKANRERLGGIPNPIHVTVPKDHLEQDALESFQNLGLAKFKPDTTQVIFFKSMMDRLATEKIPTIVYRPVASDPFRKLMREVGMEEIADRPMMQLIRQATENHTDAFIKFASVDHDPRLKCRAFLDSYHLSGACYKELTLILTEEFPKSVREKNKL